MGSLTGKTALVTGGARGIGAAIVRRLAAEGAEVAFAYRGADQAARALAEEIAAAGGRAHAIKADVADSAAIAALFAQCDALFGAAPNLDILVNNAGVGSDGQDASLKSGSEELFDHMMTVNAKGPYLVTQAALPLLRKSGDAAVVFVLVEGALVYSIYKFRSKKGAVAAQIQALFDAGTTDVWAAPFPVGDDRGLVAAALELLCRKRCTLRR